VGQVNIPVNFDFQFNDDVHQRLFHSALAWNIEQDLEDESLLGKLNRFCTNLKYVVVVLILRAAKVDQHHL